MNSRRKAAMLNPKRSGNESDGPGSLIRSNVGKVSHGPRMSRILIVDSDDAMRNMLRRGLEMKGHEVILAANGDEGDIRFRENRPDLVIVDIFLPEKNGLEMLMALKDEFPNMKSIMIGGMVEAVKGDDLDFIMRVAEIAGADMAIKKPFELDEILSAVNAVLGTSRPIE